MCDPIRPHCLPEGLNKSQSWRVNSMVGVPEPDVETG